MKNELKVLKSVIKADLSKNEIKVVIFLIGRKEKTISLTNSEMSAMVGMQQPNFVRALKKLKLNQVVGERKGGIFVKSCSAWSASNE